jgi:hypothetical protein
MFPFYLAGGRWALRLLLIGSLGACQRAAFQFQPVVAAPYSTSPTQPLAEPLVVPRSLEEAILIRTATKPRRMRHTKPLAQAIRASRVTDFPALRRTATATASAANTLPPQEPQQAIRPERYRSRGIALMLAFLSLTYIPFSLHNFYLGYYGRGVLAIAMLLVGLFLVVIGWPSFLFGSSMLLIGYLGLAILGGWCLWQLTDFIRIITRDLKPKNGSYGKKSD